MGYFSNGTEGLMYEEAFCTRCIHYGDPESPGCPIWFAHLLYAYEETGTDSNAEAMLDLLIPRSEDRLYNLQCTMFVEDK